ncbi:MAG: Flp pilus assembly protein CpaB [Bacteroidota bacterium]
MGNKKYLVFALLCGAVASLLVFHTVKRASKPKIVEPPKTEIVFAKVTIPARTVVTAEQLEVKPVPKEVVTKDSVIKIADIVGLITKAEIIQGEPVNINRLFRKGDKLSLSAIIPQGMRAITIPVDEVIGVAGFVRPGERVDLIGTIQPKGHSESTSWTLLQDIEVLAVSQDMGISGATQRGNGKVGTSVTLAVTPLQAEKVVLSKEKGTLHLALRPILKEAEQVVPSIRESSLLSSGKSTPTPVKREPSRKVIEIINGSKSKLITVY